MRRFLAISLLCFTMAGSASANEPEPGHLRLKDRLDRPVDGYCLDILGVGSNLRLEVPIFAHNCKPGLTPDSAIVLREDGMIEFPQVSLCITAAGVNGRALPGASILLRPCGHRTAFFESKSLQTFTFGNDGQVRLKGSSLCLAVGDTSDTTYSPNDRWRVLSVELCDSTPARYARWEINTGPFPSP